MTVGVMTKLGGGSKEQITWDTDCPEQVVEAKTRFQTLVQAGYTGWKAEKVGGGNGSKTETIKTDRFDETAEEITMVPRLVGG
jgi:hypothetical protein